MIDKSSIKVTIIIPNYNGALLLERCLDSVLGQLGDLTLEVIVVDDGSTDNSLDLLENYRNQIIIIEQKNSGPAVARNNGMINAGGEYLAFLDADDYWEPDFLRETVSFLRYNSELIAVSVSQLHRIPTKVDCVVPRLIEGVDSISRGGIVLSNFYEFWAEYNHVCTGSVLMRTAIVKKTGGQRPELRITEDLEFWAYLATFGKWGFIPKVLFVSDGGKVSKEQGWIQKNEKRWASAPTLEQWEIRILARITKDHLVSYNKAKAPIVRNLSYALMLSNRIEEARKNVRENRAILGSDILSLLMNYMSLSKITWRLLSILIKIKENNRRI